MAARTHATAGRPVCSIADARALARGLAGAGVVGVMIVWADNNGIPRSRTVPVAGLADAAARGVGVTSLFAVFDSHDGITFEHEGLATPSGDVRLVPVLDRAVALSGQPAFAWAPGRQVAGDGSPWPYDQRGALEAQVARAARLGLELRIGYEIELFAGHDREQLAPAHLGPAYSPHALLVDAAGVGNGWHIHASLWRDGENVLAGSDGPGGEGASFVAGVLRDLPAVAALSAPSVPSLMRLRPGYFSSAYAFWGVENREAALRYVPSSAMTGPAHANVELKPSDASANPYLALAALIAAGIGGIEDGLALSEPIAEDPGRWSEERRAGAGIVRLPTTPEDQDRSLMASPRVCDALGEQLLGAFRAVRRADAAWAADRPAEEIVAAHRWRY